MLWMSFHEQQFPGKWFSKILQKSPKKKVSLHISIMFIIIIFIQVMRRAHSQSPRLPTKNQHHEEAQLSHLLLLPDQASSQLPARPPSYPAAAPSHAQRERAELQLRQLGSNANVPRIRVSCEPDLAQISQLFPGQGQDNRGRSPGRSGAWESEVERQMPKTSHDWSWADHAIFTPLAAGNKLLALSPTPLWCLWVFGWTLWGKSHFLLYSQTPSKWDLVGFWWLQALLSFLSSFVLYKISLILWIVLLLQRDSVWWRLWIWLCWVMRRQLKSIAWHNKD